MHDSRVVANRFLTLAQEHGDSLTPMQVLKLVYIAHGWMLGLYGRPLIKDDVQAWQYGPVIPGLYNAMRQFKSRPVEGQLRVPAYDPDVTTDESSVISQVYDLYGSKSGPQLSRLTHASGTPWDLTYTPGEFGTVIPSDLIEDHYRRLARERAT